MTYSKNKSGYLVLSFDTELAWGQFDHFESKKFSKYGKRERTAIERLLDLLNEFGIVATWGVVGHLFYEKCENCDVCPLLDWSGKYTCFDRIYKTNDPLWYGADVIELLLNRSPMHEIAFHGYTHKLFDENSMSEYEARLELQEWCMLSKRKDILPQTVIFPRNNIGYLEVIKEFGFICYRGKELMPPLYSSPFIGRILRRYHRFLSSFTVSQVYDIPNVESNGLVNIPSTQHFFGFDYRYKRILDSLRLDKFIIKQMIRGIKKAADEGKIIHIRAHPSDFQSEKDFENLHDLFSYAANEISRGRLRSIGMAELARRAFYRIEEFKTERN